MLWVTRERPHIDRIACAWAIKKFIDSEAEFLFITREEKPPEDAVPYDLLGAELGHHGDECSFEAVVEKYELKGRAFKEIARIVRDVDLAVYKEPESVGIEVVLKGMILSSETDLEIYELSFPVFDALYKRFSEGR